MDYIIQQKMINLQVDYNWFIFLVKGMNLIFEFFLVVKLFVDCVDDVVYIGEFKNVGYGQYKFQFKDDELGIDLLKDDLWKFIVMYINDMYVYFDNVVRWMMKIKEIRSEIDSSILFDVGDVFLGDFYFIKWQGLVDLKLMNSMGYDVMIFGNYEFDKGLGVFVSFLSGNGSVVDLFGKYYF